MLCRVAGGVGVCRSQGGDPTMQRAYNARSENTWAQLVRGLNRRWAAAIGTQAEVAQTHRTVRGHIPGANAKASRAMTRMLCLLCFVAALAAGSPASFAQRQEITGPPR